MQGYDMVSNRGLIHRALNTILATKSVPDLPNPSFNIHTQVYVNKSLLHTHRKRINDINFCRNFSRFSAVKEHPQRIQFRVETCCANKV
jgi:hypothetical protein